MTSKFGGNFFGAEAHAAATDRMQTAAEELKVMHEQEDRKRAKEEEKARQQRKRQPSPQVNGRVDQTKQDAFVSNSGNNEDENDSDDDLLDELEHDPELEALRAARLKELKKEHEEKQSLLAKGHGEFREISQDEFLKEVTSSPLVAVHFYHNDFERCKIMDMHLGRLAKKHIECKFLKMNAEKAPFFVDKLVVRVLPTVICFRDGVAFPERVIGFDGLVEDDETEEIANFGTKPNIATSKDNFPTIALARKLVEIGVIKSKDLEKEDYQ